jgi:4-amino-4-deoxy-L-arabinose transferase-like glycosyltransferase
VNFRHGAGLLALVIAAFCVALFILNGISLIPYPGLQNDEAFFSAALYDPNHVASVLRVFGRPIPLMHLTYVGTLKAWLCAPILKLWGPDPYSIRLPALLIGSGTIVLFFLLLRRAAGAYAAIIGTAVLSADPIFLLTNLFDWGPVALQFLLTVGGCYCLLRFAQKHTRPWLSSGFLLFGLALWHKAVFVWTLVALLVATLVLFRKELARASTRRNLALAFLSFSIGAFPFLRYNLQRPLATFRENAGYSLFEAKVKAHVMRGTLDGSALFGYMVWENAVENPLPAETRLERLSFAVSELAGQPHRTVLPWLVAPGIVLIPLLWNTSSRRPALFGAIVFLLMWAQMLCSKGAGSAVHHSVLAWPWPHFLIGASFAGLAGRYCRLGVALALTVTLAGFASSLLVTNQYRTQLIRNGAKQSWSDAIFPLSSLLSRLPAEQVVLVDWGMLDSLRLLHNGKLPLRWGAPPFLKPVPDASNLREIHQMLATPGLVFVGHADGHEQFAGVNENLRRITMMQGFRKQLLYGVRDRNGRAVFEVFRFRQATT